MSSWPGLHGPTQAGVRATVAARWYAAGDRQRPL